MRHHQDSRAAVVRDVGSSFDEGLTALRNPNASSWIGRVRSAVVANDVCNDLPVAGLLDLDSGGPVPGDCATDHLESASVEADDPKPAIVLDRHSYDVGERTVSKIHPISHVVLDRSTVDVGKCPIGKDNPRPGVVLNRIAPGGPEPAGLIHDDARTAVVLHNVPTELERGHLTYIHSHVAVVLDC